MLSRNTEAFFGQRLPVLFFNKASNNESDYNNSRSTISKIITLNEYPNEKQKSADEWINIELQPINIELQPLINETWNKNKCFSPILSHT